MVLLISCFALRSTGTSPDLLFGKSFEEDDVDQGADTKAVEEQVLFRSVCVVLFFIDVHVFLCRTTKVVKLVSAAKLIPDALVESEVNWFFNELGIEASYFLTVAPKKLAEHVLAIFGAKGEEEKESKEKKRNKRKKRKERNKRKKEKERERKKSNKKGTF